MLSASIEFEISFYFNLRNSSLCFPLVLSSVLSEVPRRNAGTYHRLAAGDKYEYRRWVFIKDLFIMTSFCPAGLCRQLHFPDPALPHLFNLHVLWNVADGIGNLISVFNRSL